MFKLIKLAFYVFIGYALYELYQGMMSGQGAGASAGAGERARAGIGGGGEGANRMTGGGRGRTERTEESGGTSTPHQVGRGVV